MSQSLRVAKICWVAPLAFGIFIFVLWLATGWIWTVFAGVGVFWLGVGSFVVGLAALARYWWIARSSGVPAMPQAKRNIARLAALLCSNFVVAGGLFVAFVALSTRYVLVIENTASETLVDVQVSSVHRTFVIGDLAAGESKTQSLWVDDDYLLDLLATTADGRKVRARVDEYPMDGCTTTVLFGPDGEVTANVRKRGFAAW